MKCCFGKDCNNEIFIYMREGEPICRECFTVLDSKFFELYVKNTVKE